MKKTSHFLTILATLGLCLGACQPTETPITIGEQDAGRTITLKTGDVLVVELAGNMTTGFSWVPAPQEPVLLSLAGEPEFIPESELIGAPGKIVLHFKAAARGQTVLHLDYKRPWETDVPPVGIYQVAIVVE